MRPRGFWVLVALVAFVGLFMSAVWVLGNEVRQEYRVASRGDTERLQLDLSATHAVWVERTEDGGWAVVGYDLAAQQRRVLEPRGAAPGFPVAAQGEHAAWVREEPPGRYTVLVHHFPTNTTLPLDSPEENLTLPGRTLEGGLLVATGTFGPGLEGVFVFNLTDHRGELLRVQSAPRILDGSVHTWDWRAPSSPLRLAEGRLWWSANATVHSMDLEGRGSPTPFEAGGRVLSLDAHGDVVVWAEDRGLVRRVHFRSLANGTQGEASGFPGDQHSPAVHGDRVVLVQHDRLVRLKDLGTGEERVLPARTQENRELRLGSAWAAWLSGTLEGHNVLLVPVR